MQLSHLLPLILFSRVVLGAAEMAAPQFDYIGSDHGDILLKLDCHWREYAKTLACEGTRVKVVLPGKKEVPSFLSPEMDKLIKRITQKRLAKEQAEEKEKLLADPDEFADKKKEVCAQDPRDRFQFRGAYHKSYDAFLSQLRRLESTMCQSSTVDDFLLARKQIDKFSEQVCELNYQKFFGDFVREKVGYRWSSNFTFPNCRFQVLRTIEYDPNASKSPWVFWEKVDQTVGRRELAACVGRDSAVTVRFASLYDIKRPSGCDFILDRERDWECCAFE